MSSFRKKDDKLKIFHSYSHKDEEFRKEFSKRLTTMRNNGLIDEWYDRKMNPGDILNQEIRDNLHKSDIFAFLVSSDFLSSKACMDELEEARIAMKNDNKKKLIPIILRPCDWQNNSTLKEHLALPKDGKSITQWDNTDEAWEDVRYGIERVVSGVSLNDSSSFPLNRSFVEELNDMGFQPNHPRKSDINLKDLFIYPQVEKYIPHELSETINTPISSESIIHTENLTEAKIAIEGTEQIGKTSLLKMLFLKLYQNNALPLFIKGGEIRNHNIDTLIKKSYEKQYTGNAFEKFSESKREKIIIIDDWHLMKINEEERETVLQFLQSRSYGLIISFNETYNLVANQLKKSKSTYAFDLYRIKPFGHVLRTNLIQRWLLIGNPQEYESSKEFLKTCDTYKDHIDLILGKSFLPACPLFIVLILQMKENRTSQKDLHLTSYGHYYHFLILGSLGETADIPNQQIDTYLNYLTELSYFIFTGEEKRISEEQIKDFHSKYSEMFSINISFKEIIDRLRKSSILHTDSSGLYSFKYEYIYYYFVAKYLADNISESQIQEIILSICSELHKKDYANIMIFVSHHTKNKFILDKIISNANNLYQNDIPADLSKEKISFMDDLIKQFEVPKIQVADHKEERNRRLESQDRNEEIEEDSDDTTETVLILNQGIKTLEILGQILKNRHGSLEKTKQSEIFKEGQNLGLRMLGNFHKLLSKVEIDSFIDELARIKKTDKKEIDREKFTQFIAYLGYKVTFGFLRKISHSLGSENILQIADRINKEINTPASKIINFYIHQWFEKKLDVKELENIKQSLSGNVFAERMLTEVVIDHLYMHPVEPKERHKVANILGIPIDDQVIMQEKRKK
ncbi:MAG: TIR domain-containing protein [Candidatus Dadabacteria bacterium]|nr:TIR domain-containing protein [Candidatus Dadabacteria bacterium]